MSIFCPVSFLHLSLHIRPGGARRKNFFIFALTSRRLRWYTTPAQKEVGTVPRPHPRPEPKGQHRDSAGIPAWFVVTWEPDRWPTFFIVWRCFPIATTGHQTNDEIRDKEVRLISESGEQLGIMSSQEALRLAEERDLDLVKISPNAVPPVCKLMDYGKYRFEQTKREKEARKNQRVVEVKEIRMSPSIDVNDFNVKLRNAQKFLSEGNRCKITVRFRGREMAHTNIGQDLLVKFAEDCGEVAVMDKSPKLEGRHMSIFLSPKPSKDAKK